METTSNDAQKTPNHAPLAGQTVLDKPLAKTTLGQNLMELIEIIPNTPINDVMLHHFEKFISELKTNINKCRYRKALEDIREKGIKFDQMKDFWIIFDLKLKCMRKVIERKFSKGLKAKNLESWLLRIDITLEEWYSHISDKSKYGSGDTEIVNIQVELLIKNILHQCYHYALLAKQEKQIADSIGFLSLGERLIKFIIDFTNLPDTMNIIQKILLFMSSILIADCDFETAKKYQANCLKIALRELYQRIDFEEGINIEKMTKQEFYTIRKCILNIVIAFFHKGVCEENLGSILKAIESYKQARWFSVNFLKQTDSELTQFIEDVEVRSLHYNNLLNNISSNANQKLNMKETQNNFKSSLYHNEDEKLAKYNDQSERIKSMTFQEIEDNDILVKKSDSIKFVLSTVKTVNNLLSSKFRNMIHEIKEKDLNICNLSKELKDKIQRRLNEVKAEKLYEENKKRHKESQNSPITQSNDNKKRKSSARYNNDNELLDDNIFQLTEQSLESQNSDAVVKESNKLKKDDEFAVDSKKETRPTTSICPVSKKGMTSRESSKINITNHGRIGSSTTRLQGKTSNQNVNDIQASLKHHIRQSASTNYNLNTENLLGYNCEFKNLPISNSQAKFVPNEDPIRKYEFSKYISNKSFQNKVTYLNTIDQKELDFQKKLLRSKLNEKQVFEKLDLKKVDEGCDQFFHKIYASTKKNFIEDEKLHKKKELLMEEKMKNDKLQAELTRKVLKSGDYKMLQKLKKLIKAVPEKRVSKNRNALKVSSILNNHATPPKNEKILKNNVEKEKLITHQINAIHANEQNLNKIVSPQNPNARKSKHITKTLSQILNSKVNNFIQSKVSNYKEEDSV